MPTYSGFPLVDGIDILARVSIVLAVGMLVSRAVRRSAAIGHVILVLTLATVFAVPVLMLAMRRLPVPRVELGQLGELDRGPSAAEAPAQSRPPTEELHGHTVPPHSEWTNRGSSDGANRPQPGAPVFPASDKQTRRPGTSRWSEAYGTRFFAGALVSAVLAGALFKTAGLALSMLRLRGIVSRSRPASGARLPSMLGLVQQQVGMRGAPLVWESAEISIPVAAGAVGDHILLPEGHAGTLSDDDLFAVLCHESAHLARRDHRVVILQELLASLLWFHPLVYRFNGALNRVREELCDNYVLNAVDRPAYCEALLRIAVGPSGATPRGAATMWSGNWRLEDRIRGILDERRFTTTRVSGVVRSAAAALFMVVCALIAVPQVTASRANAQPRSSGQHEPQVVRPAGVPIEATRTIIRAFPVSQKDGLRIQNLAGRVELVPGHGSAVRIEAIVRVGDLAPTEVKRVLNSIRWVEVPSNDARSRWGLSFPADDYPTVRYPVTGETKVDSDTVRYLGRDVRISRRPGNSIPSVEFDLQISVPPGIPVSVENLVGPIGGRSVRSPLRLSTRHGAIIFGDVSDAMDASAEFGDLLISRIDADAVLRTGSGTIDLANVKRGRVSLTTRSGNCRIVQPAELDFKIRYSGVRPIDVLGSGFARMSEVRDGQTNELLSRGAGGASVSISSGTGQVVVVSGR